MFRGRLSPRLLRISLLTLLSLLLAARYFWIYGHHPLGPGNALPAEAWFGWADQGSYVRAARGWASGDLDPSQHLYPAGYALLGALFVPLTPAQPFLVPDLLCWVGSLWLFAELGAALGGGIPGLRAVSAGVFFLVTVSDLNAFYTWEVPWTSTPATALTFASLLLALRDAEGDRPRRRFAAAALSGCIVLFRPTDALVIMPVVGLLLLVSQWRRRRDAAAVIPFLALTGCGYAIGPALLLATHVATHGWHLGYYFAVSGLIGFEWRLLPLRWVTLMLNPRPLHPGGEGFAQVYWYVLPGMAGVLAAVLADPGRRVRHVLVGGGAIVFVCVYLCYRDLQVLGLFPFNNQHYFKWTLPVFGLYALALPYLMVVRGKRVAGSAALVAVAALSCWRAELAVVPATPVPEVLPDGRGVALPGGLAAIDAAVLVAAPDDFLAIYLGKHTLDRIGPDEVGPPLTANAAFKVLPMPFGLMVLPLRPLPGPAVLHLAAPLRLDPAAPVRSARQVIRFGLPCAVLPGRADCRFPPILRAGAGK